MNNFYFIEYVDSLLDYNALILNDIVNEYQQYSNIMKYVEFSDIGRYLRVRTQKQYSSINL